MRTLRDNLPIRSTFEKDANRKYMRKSMMFAKGSKKYQLKNYRKLNILISKVNSQKNSIKKFRLNMYNKHSINGRSK